MHIGFGGAANQFRIDSRWLVAIAILFFHLLIVWCFWRSHSIPPLVPERALAVKLLYIQPIESTYTDKPLVNLRPSLPRVSLPDISLIQPDNNSVSGTSVATAPHNSVPFDPQLREILNQQKSTELRASKSDSWVNSAGTKVVEVSQGRCVEAMPSMLAGERGTQWSFSKKCGKDQGDTMMDNVNADVEWRKRKMKH